jgi:hypothetical protein
LPGVTTSRSPEITDAIAFAINSVTAALTFPCRLSGSMLFMLFPELEDRNYKKMNLFLMTLKNLIGTLAEKDSVINIKN